MNLKRSGREDGGIYDYLKYWIPASLSLTLSLVNPLSRQPSLSSTLSLVIPMKIGIQNNERQAVSVKTGEAISYTTNASSYISHISVLTG